jgi:hypothetical protein
MTMERTELTERSDLEVEKGAQRTPFRFPRALAWALGVPLALSLMTWFVAVEWLSAPGRSVLVLGDSNVANYRLVDGQRFEDVLTTDLGPGWVVRNWGDPGADPADYYLLLGKAELVRWKPDVVVVALSPHAFIPDTTNWGHRFRDNGDNLRFLPWTAEGFRFFETLTRKEKESAVVGAMERLFGFFDGYSALRRHADWPAFRASQAKVDPRVQTQAVENYSHKITKWLDQNVVLDDYADFSQRVGSRDFGFFTDAMAARGTPFVVLVLPQGNPAIIDRNFSDRTRATLEHSYEFTLRFLNEHHVSYVDYNSPTERPRFDASQYGDHYHLKTASAYRYMADGIARWIATHGPRGS